MRIIEKYFDDPCDTLDVMDEWRAVFRRTAADSTLRDAKALRIRQMKSDEEASRFVLSLTADTRKKLDGQATSTPSVSTTSSVSTQNTAMGLRMSLKRNAAVLGDNSMMDHQRHYHQMAMMSTATPVAAKQPRLDGAGLPPTYCQQQQQQYLNLLAQPPQSSLQGLHPPAPVLQHSHQQLNSAPGTFFAFRNGSNLGNYPFVYYGSEEAGIRMGNDERSLFHQHPQHFSATNSIQVQQAMSASMINSFYQQQQTAMGQCDGNMK